MSGRYNVAVVGATGAVGETLLAILEEREFPVANLHAVASRRSAGAEIEFRGKTVVVEVLEDFDFEGVISGSSPRCVRFGGLAPKAVAAAAW